MNKKEYDYLNLKIYWLFFLIIMILIKLFLNPHYEMVREEVTELIDINTYKELSEGEVLGSNVYIQNITVVYCTENIEYKNNFKELCRNVNKSYYCHTKPVWEFEGIGYCLIRYDKKIKGLRFG